MQKNALTLVKKLIMLLFCIGILSCSRATLSESKWQVDCGEKDGVRIGENINFHLKSEPKIKVDSLVITLDEKETLYAGAYNDKMCLEPKTLHDVGSHCITVTLSKGKETLRLLHTLRVRSNVRPQLMSYEVVNVYPHDTSSFCQGLEYNYRAKNTFYESAGLYGASKLKIVALKNGHTVKEVSLDPNYFAEGLTVFQNQLLLLSWRENIGFVYNPSTLRQENTFRYHQSKEGWGLTNDGQKVYKSDGTEKIWILEPPGFNEGTYISVYDDQGPVLNLNELEWIEGRIYANIWRSDTVAVIDPSTGIVEKYVDLSGLLGIKDKKANTDVLNGIAYDHATKRIFVTGKRWPKLFEIRLKKQPVASD